MAYHDDDVWRNNGNNDDEERYFSRASRRKYFRGKHKNFQNHHNNRVESTRFGCILKYQDKLLCVKQRSNMFWGFPKGSQEYVVCDKDDDDDTKPKMRLETEFETCKREVKEETGVNIDDVDLSKCLKLVTSPDSRFGIRKYVYYLVICSKMITPTIEKDNYEIEEVEWLTVDELMNRKRASFTTNVIRQFQKLRTHNL